MGPTTTGRVIATLRASAESRKMLACGGCSKDIATGSSRTRTCANCLMGMFCTEECLREGWEKHKIACPQLAKTKLTLLSQELLDDDDSLEGRFDSIWGSVYCDHTLPEHFTEEQLDQLVSLHCAAFSVLDKEGRAIAYKVLDTATRYSMQTPRPTAKLEKLIKQSRGVLEASPPVSEEEGAMLWGSNPVYGLCLNVGSLLAKMGKHREAVQFLQSVKPNLEVAFLLQSPTSDSQEPISCLVTLNKVHATWLNQCIPTDLSKAELLANPDRRKRMELLKQVLEQGRTLKDPQAQEDAEVAHCGVQLGLLHLRAEEPDKALQVLKTCLKLPWNKVSGLAAVTCIQCHILAGRDSKALKWIDQLLVGLDQLSPGYLTPLDRGALFSWRSLIFRRMGRYEEALAQVQRAEELLKQATNMPGLGDSLEEALSDAVFDRLDCLDKLHRWEEVGRLMQELGADNLRRPLTALCTAETLLGQGEHEPAVGVFVLVTEELCRGTGFSYWRWRMKGITLWGMQMLAAWEKLARKMLPEGENRATILARIEEMRGMEDAMKQKLLEDRRAQAIREVREQVTGKPAAEEENILEELRGKPAVEGEGSVEAADETPGDRKPSKAARKKRKKRQKKAAQAQQDASSTQQEAEAGLEEGMAGLGVSQEDDKSVGEAEAGPEETQAVAVTEQEECAICLNELGGEVGGEQEVLACGHVLHASCLGSWVSKCESLCIDTTCPVCREPVASR